MRLLLLALASIWRTSDCLRISSFTRGSGKFQSGTSLADPYGWKIQSNPVSKNSCYSLVEESKAPVKTVFDTACVGFSKSDEKCRGGFPFYRFSAGSPNCVDCMDAPRCQMICLSKGMDAAAIVIDKTTRNPVECRCGATKKNLPVWNMLRSASSDGEINFGPVHGLLPPTVNSALPSSDPRCAMFVYTYTDSREADGGVPSQFVETGTSDDFYIRSIVSGQQDPGDVEDSTVEDMAKVHFAMKQRLELWLQKNPTGKVPRDEIFVEQTDKLVQSDSPASCQGIDEPYTCFDDGIDSVISANGWKRQSIDGSLTPEFTTAMMTVSFENWQALFGAGTDKVSVGPTTQFTKSGFCSNQATASKCPITCGKCKLFDRSSARASMYESWLATNKDSKTGIVTIPFMFDTANRFVTSDVVDLIRNATAIWASVTCVSFKEVTKSPQGQRYILITADTDSNGNPSGCLADPVGLPQDASHPTRINVGGCKENKKPLGSIVHEFGHVLGLVHTQMRPDRDQFISMNPAMVKPGFEANFFLSPYAFDGDDGVYSPYDYGSIMHYTRTQAANAAKYQASSTDWSGTFKVLQSLAAGVTLGQRDQLSALDIAEVNSIYQCGNVLAANPTAATTTLAPLTTSTASSPSVVGSPTNSTKPWENWEDDMEAIADAISAILKSSNVNLSDQQVDILDNMTKQEKLIFDQADRIITLGKISADWRQSVVNVAKTVLLIVSEARRGIELYRLGKNAEQEGVLDNESIDNLMKIVQHTKIIYNKIESYLKTLPGYVALDAKDQQLSRHPAPREAVLVFG